MSNNQLEFFLPANQEITAEVNTPRHEKPALFLIDGMAIVYRAFFALQRAGMTSRDGMPTGAIYGFASALFKIFETYKPHYLAAVFDSKEKTFRHDIYPAYKANRQAPPEDLIMQLDAVFELLDALDIPLLKAPGYEADDLIGTASRKFEDRCQVYIVTPDKDLAQLVHDGVNILRPGKNQNELELLGQKEIAEQFGVAPELFTQFLTLTGDTSDNIPGARGIGPKTASALLDKYGSLQNIYKHLDDISPKNRISLEEFQPRLDLITELVTIRTDLQIDVTLKELACGTPDRTKLLPLLHKLGLKSIIARLPAVFYDDEHSPTEEAQFEKHPTDTAAETEPELRSPQTGADYALVDTAEKLDNLILSLENVRRVAVDTETTSLDTFEAELAGISFSIEPGKARFISFANTALQRESTLEKLRPVLENPLLFKTGQNLKYDILVLKKYGIELSPVGFDSMLASYVLDPEEQHNLDDLAARRGRSGKGDPVDVLVGGQRRARRCATARNHVDHPCGHAGFRQNAGEHQRRERHLQRRLEHQRAARGEHGADRPQLADQRTVPRNNAADHADGRALGVGHVIAGEAVFQQFPLQIDGLAGVEAEGLLHPALEQARARGGGAHVDALQPAKIGIAILQHVGDAQHQHLTIIWRPFRPRAIESRTCGGHGTVDIDGIPTSDLGDHLPRRGGDAFEGAAVGVDPFATNEQALHRSVQKRMRDRFGGACQDSAHLGVSRLLGAIAWRDRHYRPGANRHAPVSASEAQYTDRTVNAWKMQSPCSLPRRFPRRALCNWRGRRHRRGSPAPCREHSPPHTNFSRPRARCP